ncbi:DUF2510 domain-containing protein [Microbacterium sp. SA39]|uniref:DUF2510 domain-containing protein n=1 Tax=Microbacterium sp. SA39 TaxID=1263625 RepID=UPI00061EEEE4|nr:DUF2510 domain-containing protein [Microbacterium sp. SA39]KJQ54381.1 Telomeric repeat-binding factor 2 [Microbacterium sp. SA39]
MTTPNDTPAGWYDDGSGRQRWWDGQQWGAFADAGNEQTLTTTDVPDPSAGAAPKKLNVVALVSAIAAAIGFILACIPVTIIAGWIVLSLTFVLSIVSLFFKGDKKWLGIVGLVLSIVGPIIGVVVFLGVAAAAVNEALEKGDTTITESDGSGDADDSDDEEAADEGPGSRENPLAIGSEISTSDWTVVVNSVNPDGTAIVAQAASFNEPAPAGSHYEIINYTITYKGEGAATVFEVFVDAVTSGGNVVTSHDHLVSLPDDIALDQLYAGGSLTGSAAYLIPDGETILVRVTPGGLADDEVFVQP